MPTYTTTVTWPGGSSTVGTYINAEGTAKEDGGTPAAYVLKCTLANGANNYSNQENVSNSQNWTVRIPSGTGTMATGSGYTLTVEMIVGGSTVATASVSGLTVSTIGPNSGGPIDPP